MVGPTSEGRSSLPCVARPSSPRANIAGHAAGRSCAVRPGDEPDPRPNPWVVHAPVSETRGARHPPRIDIPSPPEVVLRVDSGARDGASAESGLQEELNGACTAAGNPTWVRRDVSPRRVVASAGSRLSDSGFVRRIRYVGGLPERPLHLRPVPLAVRSEEHTSELQSQSNLVCRLLL